MMKQKNNLKLIREAIRPKLTQSALGQLCNPPISDVNISRYEKGHVSMTEEIVLELARALKTTPAKIRGYDDIHKTDKETIGNSTLGSLSTVPIVGFRNSGGIVELFDTDDELLDRFDCPEDLKADRTEGYRIFQWNKEWIVFFEKTEEGKPMPGVLLPDYIGEVCLVTVSNPAGADEILIMRVEHGSKKGYYDLHGLDSSEKVLKDCFVTSSLMLRAMSRVLNKSDN